MQVEWRFKLNEYISSTVNIALIVTVSNSSNTRMLKEWFSFSFTSF